LSGGWLILGGGGFAIVVGCGGSGCFVIIYGQSLATKFLEELIRVKRERLQLE